MGPNDLVRSLSVELPEDIARFKAAGRFEEAVSLIDARLETDIPEMLRRRLTVEKERLRRLPAQYPFDREEVMAALNELLPGFTDEDLKRYEACGLADWIFLEGRKKYFVRAHRSLQRCHAPGDKENPYLDKMIAALKKDGSLTYRITLEAGIAPNNDRIVPGRYRAWLPVPIVYGHQSGVEILNGSPDIVNPPDAPGRSAFWDRRLDTAEPFRIRYRYLSAIRYVSPLEEGSFAGVPYPGTPAPGPEDLEEDGLHIRFTPYLRSLAREITEGCGTDLEKAWAIYCFITQKVKYTFMRQYFLIDRIGEYAAVNRRGDCGLQAILFINLCRICGIPARWQSGMSIGADGPGDHDWAQFYVEPWGWLFADPSFGGSAWRAGASERHAFYFGNIDPMRMAANRVFMASLDPPNELLRIDPYDMQEGEIERVGASRPLMSREIDTYKILIDAEPVRS